MLPRSSMRRVIHIATNGTDIPYCGLRYFMPCATFEYATTLVESNGPWIEFIFAAGDYHLATAITIDWTGTILRGTGNWLDGRQVNGGTRLIGDKRIVVNAPSCRLINIAIVSFGAAIAPIVINSG